MIRRRRNEKDCSHDSFNTSDVSHSIMQWLGFTARQPSHTIPASDKYAIHLYGHANCDHT